MMGRTRMVSGQRFGRWIVESDNPIPTGAKKALSYWCRCDCGERKLVDGTNLRRGLTQSCGCGKHGPLRHGEADTRLHIIWMSMRRRCGRPTHRYSDRGISVCAEWQSYEAFRDWSRAHGYADNLTLDRIDNDGNYEPGNCRWVNQSIQMRNTSVNHLVTAFGETKTLIEWSEDRRCSVRYGTLWKRLDDGWNAERAIIKPKRVYGVSVA